MAKYFGVLNVDDGNGIEFTRYGGVNINFSKAYVVEELEDDIRLCWGQNGAKEWQYVVIDGYYGKCNIIAKSSVYMNKNDFIKVLKKARNFDFEKDLSDVELLDTLIESKKENKTMGKSIKEKRISTEDKIQTLAEYKGVEIDEVEEGYDENHFKVDGEEWIVADYDTAYDLAVDYTEQLFDELGIELVNEDVQNYFLENEEYCSFPWEDDMHEYNLGYARDINSESGSSGYATRLVEEAIDRKVIEEKDCFENEDGELDYEDTNELVEMLADDMDDDYDSISEWFESIYGRGWAREMKDTLENYLDYRAMAKYVVDKDGIAYSLASWDSKEVELTKDLYGYRTN